MKHRTFCGIVCLLSLLFLASGHSQQSRVRIGCTGMLSSIDAVKVAGFDYVELNTTEIVSLSDADFAKLEASVKQSGFPVYATSNFIPASMKLTGPAVDPDAQMAYVRKAFERVSLLGSHLMVFGSGPARTVPAGFSHDEAFRQLVDFCKRIAPEARAKGIVVAIEPQNLEQSNIINSTAEGLKLLDAVNDPNIQLVLDIYYLDQTHEDPAEMIAAKQHIVHFHFSNPNGRMFPLHWEEYNYAPFFAALRRMDYAGAISIDAHSKDFAKEAPQTVAFLHDALSR
ncbi:MAG: sugar phosphate isomerase/epimerase family protein [Candidatus Acidiferrales bacterium]